MSQRLWAPGECMFRGRIFRFLVLSAAETNFSALPSKLRRVLMAIL